MKTPTEQLHTCDKCGQGNFTARGLKNHNCEKRQLAKKSVKVIKSNTNHESPQTNCRNGSSEKLHRILGNGSAGQSSTEEVQGNGQDRDSEKIVSRSPARSIRGRQEGELESSPAKLVDVWSLPIDQLAANSVALHISAERYDALSGIAATLCGVVLLAAKQKCQHGTFMKWVKGHLSVSHDTAERYMKIGKEFLDADGKGKIRRPADFDKIRLSLDSSNQLQLNLSNPIIARIAKFTGGKNRTQLYASEGPGKGNYKRERVPPETPEQILFRVKNEADRFAVDIYETMFFRAEHWKLLSDNVIDGLQVFMDEKAKEMRRHLQTTPAKRKEHALLQLNN